MGAYRRNGPPSPYGYLFSRSGNAPLHISARLCQETGSAECQARYCSQHISCCASLKLVFKNERSIHFDDVWAWLSQAAPSPEALYLYADDDAIRGIIPGKLFNGEVPPRLCHITLEGLHLPLTDRSFTNLTKLRIAGMYDCPVTYVIDVLQAINASPRLEELHMESICYEGGPDLDELVETAPHNIDLSHLQHLSFRFLDVWMVQFLLNRLTIPPRAKLEIAIEDLPCDQDLSDIFPVNPANLRNLQSIHTLAFATNDDRRGCIIEGGIMTALDGGTLSTLLIVSVHCGRSSGPTQRMLSSLGPALLLMPVELFGLGRYSNRRWSASALICTLSHFPSINTFFFHDCHPKSLHALTVTPSIHPCPGLRMLGLHKCTIPDGILISTIRSRTAHNKAIHPPSAHLEYLCLLDSPSESTAVKDALSPLLKLGFYAGTPLIATSRVPTKNGLSSN